MTNEGIVTKLLPNKMAEVAVVRASACGSSCSGCESCMFANEVKAAARNLVGARPGQKVVIESRTSVIVNAALLVYVMPLIFFVAGYALAYAMGASEGICVAVSFVALLISASVLVLFERRKKKDPINYDIIEICGGGQDD